MLKPLYLGLSLPTNLWYSLTPIRACPYRIWNPVVFYPHISGLPSSILLVFTPPTGHTCMVPYHHILVIYIRIHIIIVLPAGLTVCFAFGNINSFFRIAYEYRILYCMMYNNMHNNALKTTTYFLCFTKEKEYKYDSHNVYV